MEIITMSENSNSHAYMRLDFLNRACTPGLAINSIGIKVEGLEKENESVSSKMSELEKEKEAALSKITHVEKEGEAAFSKIAVLEKEKQAAFTKIDELEKERECTAKVALFEKEKKDATRKIVVLEKDKENTARNIALLEKDKEYAARKIALLEKEKENAARKIALLEKELRTKEYIFAKNKITQLQKEKKLRTKFMDFKRHIIVVREKENEVAMSKIAMIEKELETKEVRLYMQAIRALRQIQVDDKEPKEKVKELTITVQKLIEERRYWETLAKKLKGQESEATELAAAQKEMIKVLSVYYSNLETSNLWNSKEGRKATLAETICFMGKKLQEAKIKDTGFVKVDQLKPRAEGFNLIVKVLNTNVVVDKNQNPRQQFQPSYKSDQPEITRVSESLVGDETGTIKFTARNEQDLMELGSILVLYGAKIQLYQGFMRLAVEHSAYIKIAEPVEFVVDEDEDCNKSSVEYEVIRKY